MLLLLSKPTDDAPTDNSPLGMHGPSIPAEAGDARITCFLRPTIVRFTLVE